MFWNVVRTGICILLAFLLARFFRLKSDPCDSDEEEF